MKIIEYSEEYEESYIRYTEKNYKILFFYSLKYIHFLIELLDAKNETLLVIEDNEVVAILPLLSKSGCYGKVLNSLPFYGSNGFIIADTLEAYTLLLNYYNNLITSSEVFASTVITNPLLTYKNLEHDVEHNFKDYRIGQITKFGEINSDNLMDIFHSKTRNMVRKALKSDIDITIDNSAFSFLEQVHNENMLEIGGKAKSRNFFALIKKYFKEGSDYNIFIAKKEGLPIAGLLIFYFNETVEYYTPVVKVKYRTLQPLSAIIYTAMQDAIRKKYKNWNWGGTWISQDGVYRFKKRWGTEDLRYDYYIHINKNKEELSKQILLSDYEYFYTIPFSEIK